MTTSPTNGLTVTVADAHSNSFQTANIAASDQLDAVLTFCKAQAQNQTNLAALVSTDTWTITVTPV